MLLKDATYKEKFQMLQNWMPMVIEATKKDLKNDHLKKDWIFAKRYFPGINVSKVTNQELIQGYQNAINQDEKGEDIAEYVSNCWLLKNSELYHFFEQKLSAVNPNFSEIEVLEKSKSEEISKEAIKEFGANNTYLFAILNSVAFQPNDLSVLKAAAEKETQAQAEEQEAQAKYASIEEVAKSYEVKMARSMDKYEKKILGLQAKYFKDVEALKKQVATLQSKIAKG